MSSIGTKRDTNAERVSTSPGASGGIPVQRTAADAYRVSDEQLGKARLVVAKNSGGSEDLRELLDMLGLISSNPDLPPPVVR